MGTEVDIRRITRYPPECFPSAQPVDLSAGDNRVAEYARVEPYVISFRGLSFTARDGLRFYIDADGYREVLGLADLGAVGGLDREEEVVQPAHSFATLRFTSPQDVAGYAWRHRVLVLRRTPAVKLALGLELEQWERRLAEELGLARELLKKAPSIFDLRSGFEIVRTASAVLSASGTVLRLAVPEGSKAGILGLWAERPASPGSAYLVIERDGVEEVARLDLSCLSSSTSPMPVRIVATESMEITLDVATPGTYRVGVVYGIGRLTVPEKLAWNIPLTAQEEEIAGEEGLHKLVEAGLAP